MPIANGICLTIAYTEGFIDHHRSFYPFERTVRGSSTCINQLRRGEAQCCADFGAFLATGTQRVQLTCNRCTGAGEGDVHFVGFAGQRYPVYGVHERWFALLADAPIQVSARFVFDLANPEWDGSVMDRLAVTAGRHRVRFDAAAPADVGAPVAIEPALVAAADGSYTLGACGRVYWTKTPTSEALVIEYAGYVVRATRRRWAGASGARANYLDVDIELPGATDAVSGLLGDSARPGSTGGAFVLRGEETDYLVGDAHRTDFRFAAYERDLEDAEREFYWLRRADGASPRAHSCERLGALARTFVASSADADDAVASQAEQDAADAAVVGSGDEAAAEAEASARVVADVRPLGEPRVVVKDAVWEGKLGGRFHVHGDDGKYHARYNDVLRPCADAGEHVSCVALDDVAAAFDGEPVLKQLALIARMRGARRLGNARVLKVRRAGATAPRRGSVDAPDALFSVRAYVTRPIGGGGGELLLPSAVPKSAVSAKLVASMCAPAAPLPAGMRIVTPEAGKYVILAPNVTSAGCPTADHGGLGAGWIVEADAFAH